MNSTTDKDAQVQTHKDGVLTGCRSSLVYQDYVLVFCLLKPMFKFFIAAREPAIRSLIFSPAAAALARVFALNLRKDKLSR